MAEPGHQQRYAGAPQQAENCCHLVYRPQWRRQIDFRQCTEQALFGLGHNTYLLDGDNIRHGLCHDLGFNDRDRVENIRRVAEVARLMVDAGLIVLTAFISPFKADRRMARALFEEGEFIEVHVKTPLVVCERRDPKGLYTKARRGEIQNFTGIDSPYEEPVRAEIVIETERMSVQQVVEHLLETLEKGGCFEAPITIPARRVNWGRCGDSAC